MNRSTDRLRVVLGMVLFTPLFSIGAEKPVLPDHYAEVVLEVEGMT